ncbi:Uncharacterised protein [Klebsiella pneumoniae]|nr:hypothetical protein A6D83_29020 [Klebsiella pneumoniae]SVK54183.1 Uncharacterised protein [Klebsiella pneumoniae]SVK70147.1 Uncharacterised protein [Klebsiella pneumoniae]SVK81968.1 Uncharacterised protein [Klebsiella pneumoniae]SVM94565.1 Uncharacterised protein [Klebsiella pneumoniae]
MSASEMKEICLDVTGVDKELKSLPIDKALAFLHNLKGNDSNLLIVFYVQIMPDDFVMQLHRF